MSIVGGAAGVPRVPADIFDVKKSLPPLVAPTPNIVAVPIQQLPKLPSLPPPTSVVVPVQQLPKLSPLPTPTSVAVPVQQLSKLSPLPPSTTVQVAGAEQTSKSLVVDESKQLNEATPLVVTKERKKNDKWYLIGAIIILVLLGVGAYFLIDWLVKRNAQKTQQIAIATFAFAAPTGTYTTGSDTQVLLPSLNVFSDSQLTLPANVSVTFVYSFSSSTNPTNVGSATVTDSNGKNYVLTPTGTSSNANVALTSVDANTQVTFTMSALDTSTQQTVTAPATIDLTYRGQLPNAATIGLSGPTSAFRGRAVAHTPKSKAYYDPRLGLLVAANNVALTFNGGPYAMSGFYTVVDGNTSSNVNLTSSELTGGSFTIDTTQYITATLVVSVTLSYYKNDGTIATIVSNTVIVKNPSGNTTPVSAVSPVGFNTASAQSQSAWLPSTTAGTGDSLYLYFNANGSFTGGTVTTTPTSTTTTIPAPGSAGLSNDTQGNYWIQITAPQTAGSYDYTIQLTPTGGGSAVSSTAPLGLTVTAPVVDITGVTAVGYNTSNTATPAQWQTNANVEEGTDMYLYFTVTPANCSFGQGSFTTSPTSSFGGTVPASINANVAGSGLFTDNNGNYWVPITSPSPPAAYTYQVSLPTVAGGGTPFTFTSANTLTTTSAAVNVQNYGLFFFNGISIVLSSSSLSNGSTTLCTLGLADVLSTGYFVTASDAQSQGLLQSTSQWTIKSKCPPLACSVESPVTVTTNAYFYTPIPVPDSKLTNWIYTVAQFRPQNVPGKIPQSYVVNFFDPGLSQIATLASGGQTSGFNLCISFYNLYASDANESVGTTLNLCTVAGTTVTPIISNVDYLSCVSYTYTTNPTGNIVFGFVPSTATSPTVSDLIKFYWSTTLSPPSTTYPVPVPTKTDQTNNIQLFLRNDLGNLLFTYASGTVVTASS